MPLNPTHCTLNVVFDSCWINTLFILQQQCLTASKFVAHLINQNVVRTHDLYDLSSHMT